MSSRLVLSATVRKKADAMSEGGSSSSEDKVSEVGGSSGLSDFESRESPSIPSRRVQFEMDQDDDPIPVVVNQVYVAARSDWYRDFNESMLLIFC